MKSHTDELDTQANEIGALDGSPIGTGLPDVITVALAHRRSGISRERINAAIKRRELTAIKYGRSVLIRRPEYVRWINSLGTPVEAYDAA